MYNCVYQIKLKSNFLSVFEPGPIPYPKREFLTDDEDSDKSDKNQNKQIGHGKVGRK